MKRLLCVVTLAMSLFSGSIEAAKCNPDGICKACRDCTNCAYCTSGKGSCSVCRDQTGEQTRRREAIKDYNRRKTGPQK